MIGPSSKIHTTKVSVLVTASQGVEAYITQELKLRGFEVKILARNLKKTQKIAKADAEIIQDVATLPRTLEGNLNGVHTIISTLGISHKEKGLFDSIIDYQSNINLLREAQKAGVRKFVYLIPMTPSLGDNPQVSEIKGSFISLLKESGLSYTSININGFLSDSQTQKNADPSRKISFFSKEVSYMNHIDPKNLATACVDAIKTPFKT